MAKANKATNTKATASVQTAAPATTGSAPTTSILGARVGSQANAINAKLTAVPQTAAAIAAQLPAFNAGRVATHLRAFAQQGKIAGSGPNGTGSPYSLHNATTAAAYLAKCKAAGQPTTLPACVVLPVAKPGKGKGK